MLEERLDEIVRLDPDPSVRRAALRALAVAGSSAWARSVLGALHDPALRDDALGLLGRKVVIDTRA